MKKDNGKLFDPILKPFIIYKILVEKLILGLLWEINDVGYLWFLMNVPYPLYVNLHVGIYVTIFLQT